MAVSASLFLLLLLLVLVLGSAFVMSILAYEKTNNSSNSPTRTFDSIFVTNTTNQIALGATGTTTTINGPAPGSDITLTLPITSDTLIGRATTDTLTNKTFTFPHFTNAMDNINEAVTLSATDSGTTFTVFDAGVPYTVTLPSVATGLYYKFVVVGSIANTITFSAGSAIINGYINNAGSGAVNQNSTIIRLSLTAPNDSIDGDTFTLESDGSQWFLLGFGQQANAIQTS